MVGIRSYWEGYKSKKEAEIFQGKGCFMDFCAEIPSGTVTAKNFYRELKLFERIEAYKGLNTSPEAIMERLMINMFKKMQCDLCNLLLRLLWKPRV